MRQFEHQSIDSWIDSWMESLEVGGPYVVVAQRDLSADYGRRHRRINPGNVLGDNLKEGNEEGC